MLHYFVKNAKDIHLCDDTGYVLCVLPLDYDIPEGSIIYSALEFAKMLKLQKMSNERWKAEINGVDFNGFRIHTDRESQAKYTGAIVAYQAVGKYPAAWKTVDGWMPIETAETLLGLATAVQEHINACYAKEAALEQAIHSATTVKEVEAIKW